MKLLNITVVMLVMLSSYTAFADETNTHKDDNEIHKVDVDSDTHKDDNENNNETNINDVKSPTTKHIKYSYRELHGQ